MCSPTSRFRRSMGKRRRASRAPSAIGGSPYLPIHRSTPAGSTSGTARELHVFFVEGFTLSPFEAEFGRHVALFHPLDDFPAVRRRILDAGGELVEPLRSTSFERLFFREPINGYLFELIDRERHRQILEERS